MTMLMQASEQWAKRPNDERFLSLLDMQDHFDAVQRRSQAKVIETGKMHAVGSEDQKGLAILGADGKPSNPTHHAFNQLCKLTAWRPGDLRRLPSKVAALNLNITMAQRSVDEVQVLLQTEPFGSDTLRAATGPNYGRIWNASVTRELIKRVGDGRTGDFKVPGEFGKDVPVTKQNTTLYAGDRDMFVFLADEKNRVEMKDRRNGQPGMLARGFFLWNSEVGDRSFGIGTFLFDFVCMNRIVWGAEMYSEFTMNHTKAAPERFLSEAMPAIAQYMNAPMMPIVDAIEASRKVRVEDKIEALCKDYFGAKSLASPFNAVHIAEEGREIETLWDLSTAATAYARGIENAGDRVGIERAAGNVIRLAA